MALHLFSPAVLEILLEVVSYVWLKYKKRIEHCPLFDEWFGIRKFQLETSTIYTPQD